MASRWGQDGKVILRQIVHSEAFTQSAAKLAGSIRMVDEITDGVTWVLSRDAERFLADGQLGVVTTFGIQRPRIHVYFRIDSENQLTLLHAETAMDEDDIESEI